jgi:hypothetical protein
MVALLQVQVLVEVLPAAATQEVTGTPAMERVAARELAREKVVPMVEKAPAPELPGMVVEQVRAPGAPVPVGREQELRAVVLTGFMPPFCWVVPVRSQG